jgi:RNA polymerase sigma-70 factor (ECF subfamily)
MQFESFDEAYLAGLTSGNPEIEQHFHKYFSELILIKLRARQYTRQTIEDIRQETFLRVIQAIRKERIREPERIGAFVNSVCNNVALEFGRSGSRLTYTDAPQEDVADERADSERELVTRERQAAVREVLKDLPPKNRRLLSQAFLEERPPDEIAAQMGVDRNYLRVLLFRARAQFREAVKRRRILDH